MGIRNALFIIALLTCVIILIMITAAHADQDCEILQDNILMCKSVMQIDLDEWDILALWKVWTAQLDSNYTRPPIDTTCYASNPLCPDK